MNRVEETKQRAEEAIADEETLKQIAEALEGASRRDRQQAAAVIAVIAKQKPEALVPYVNLLVDALNRPEAQTRWEVLDALTELVPYDSRTCEKGIAGADAALFDEESGPVRLAAMRYLCKIGSTTEARSEKTWPLIDEGIQCYHGNLEFSNMLDAVVEFSAGKLSPDVRSALADRMKFDAENSKGSLKKRAQQILDNTAK